jgi:SSS family solute:Na+ symporter
MAAQAASFGVDLDPTALTIVGTVSVVYFIAILSFGILFNKFSKNTNDFFFSGQKFPFWLVGASMIATGIGSYSFLKYSQQGFLTGMSSAMTYTNDWFVIPFFMFGWLPIIYLSRVHSIPEYFERRFNRAARYITLAIIMMYMFFYIGYNLFTIGVAIEGILKINMLYALPVVTLILGVYVSLGGQTAVIMTDLVQGVILYIVGFICLAAGIWYVGGLYDWWYWLPETHRLPFVHMTENKSFNTVGLFWGEAVAGSIAFAFMNQGFIMRYLATRSVHEGRKAALMNVLISLPLSAVVVGCIGWIGKSIMEKMGGAFPGYEAIQHNTYHTFLIVAWETLQQNSVVFGLVIAALTAALMSTIDTLINACAAIGVYDLYKPLIKKDADEKHYLKAAHWASAIATLIGFCLVFVFMEMKGSLMAIHYKGIMVIIPALVTTIFLGAFWKRMTATAAVVSMTIGSIGTIMTLFYPTILDPVASFVGAAVEEEGRYIYVRAVFGMSLTAVLGFVISLFTEPRKDEDIEGLTVWSLDKAMEKFKGGKPTYDRGIKVKDLVYEINDSLEEGKIALSEKVMKDMAVHEGDLVFIEDNRWWVGGLRSAHTKAVAAHSASENTVQLSSKTFEEAMFLEGNKLRAEKIF